MKKMLRIAAALAALLAMTNFIGCKNDDDDDGDVATVAVEKVEITSTETDVEVEKTITLTAKVSPENATDKTVTWTSDNNEVATVKDGVVTGVKAGEATITASAGGKTDKFKVTVKAAATGGGETGGETGGSTGGTTGGETGGSTGGTTGGETGGSTGGETGGETGGSTGGETATPKTATIAYDGSSAENAPAATGEEGVFSDVQDVIATAGVAEGYSLDEGYPKYGSQTYTGDDGTTTSAGMLIVSNLQNGTTKVDFAANAVMAYVTYNFTLSAKSDVEAAVKAFNTQSSTLAGKIEILDSNGILKASKQADAGSKSANDVTADSVELDAGVYTLKFSWVTTKAAQLKKVNCGISSFSINATTK